jgi:hypothetical protein
VLGFETCAVSVARARFSRIGFDETMGDHRARVVLPRLVALAIL